MGKPRITDDEYAEMAADYELDPPTASEVTSVELNPAYLPTGRPNKGTRTTGKTPVLAIRLPESLRNELAHSAKAQGATTSEMIRRAVADSVSFYVLWEQTFDDDEWQWVRFDKTLTPQGPKRCSTTSHAWRQPTATAASRSATAATKSSRSGLPQCPKKA